MPPFLFPLRGSSRLDHSPSKPITVTLVQTSIICHLPTTTAPSLVCLC